MNTHKGQHYIHWNTEQHRALSHRSRHRKTWMQIAASLASSMRTPCADHSIHPVKPRKSSERKAWGQTGNQGAQAVSDRFLNPRPSLTSTYAKSEIICGENGPTMGEFATISLPACTRLPQGKKDVKPVINSLNPTINLALSVIPGTVLYHSTSGKKVCKWGIKWPSMNLSIR